MIKVEQLCWALVVALVLIISSTTALGSPRGASNTIKQGDVLSSSSKVPNRTSRSANSNSYFNSNSNESNNNNNNNRLSNGTDDPSYNNGTFINSAGEICGDRETPMCRKLDIVDMKKHSLQMIRQDILRKLRMDETRLPNVSAAGFPIPPAYLSEFLSEMQADDPPDYYDDEHATTEKIIAFSRVRKYSFSQKFIRYFEKY